MDDSECPFSPVCESHFSHIMRECSGENSSALLFGEASPATVTSEYVSILSTEGRHMSASDSWELSEDVLMFGVDPHAKSLDDPAPSCLPAAQKSKASRASIQRMNPYQDNITERPMAASGKTSVPPSPRYIERAL